MTGINPYPDKPRPCWSCQHYAGPGGPNNTAALCHHPKWPMVRATPEGGCCSWAETDKPPMRMLVCGGRDYIDERAAFVALDRVLARRSVVLVIHGAAPGGDTLADQWGEARNIERLSCPADWKRWGKMAGPIRNKEMLTHRPDGVVALPGGRGTEDMVMQALAAGLPVWRPYG